MCAEFNVYIDLLVNSIPPSTYNTPCFGAWCVRNPYAMTPELRRWEKVPKCSPFRFIFVASTFASIIIKLFVKFNYKN